MKLLPHRHGAGFTLVEVLIVVVIMAILAGAFISNVVVCTTSGQESTLRQDLGVIRRAILRYQFENDGQLPGLDKKSDTFKADLAPYLASSFPENPFGKNKNKLAEVEIKSKGTPLAVGADKGWAFDNISGEFIANSDELSCDGVTKYSEF